MSKNNQIILATRAIYNLETQKKIVCNLIRDNSKRLKLFKIINKEIEEKVESLEELLEEC